MKKRTSFLIISAMVLTLVGGGLTGCGSVSGKLRSSDLSFDYNGKKVSVKNDAEKNIEALGNPSEEQTSPNNEIDKSYVFGSETDSIELLTINDKTQSVVIHDSNVKTSRGIGVGSTYDDLIAAYGGIATTSTDDVASKITYQYDNCSLSFEIDEKNRVVTAITYSNNAMTRL